MVAWGQNQGFRNRRFRDQIEVVGRENVLD